MALPSTTLRSTRIYFITRCVLSNPFNVNRHCLASNYRYKYDNCNGEGSSQNRNWKYVYYYGMAAGFTAIALGNLMHRKHLIAEETDTSNIDQEIMNQENR